MKNLQSLLERFSNALNRGQKEKEKITSVIKDKTNILINPENIFLKNGVLEIISSPGVKSEIMMKESSIIQELKDRHSIPVIRVFYK
jgi:uncharacterized membrane protein YukC